MDGMDGVVARTTMDCVEARTIPTPDGIKARTTTTDGVKARTTTDGVEARTIPTTDGVEARTTNTDGIKARTTSTDGVKARTTTTDGGRVVGETGAKRGEAIHLDDDGGRRRIETRG
jgi:hypothetical protein